MNIKTSIQLLATAVTVVGTAYAGVTIDFNNANDLTNNFYSSVDAGAAVQNVTLGGLSNSGAVQLTAGGGSQVWTWNQPFAVPAVGASIVESLYFQYGPDNHYNASAIRFGFIDKANASSGGSNPGSGNWASLRLQANGSSDKRILDEFAYSPGQFQDGLRNMQFSDNSWYYYENRLQRTGTNSYELIWALYTANSDGSGHVLVGSGTWGFSMAGFAGAPALYAFIGMENTDSESPLLMVDNVSNASGAVIPEPAGLALLGMGALALLGRRRHRQVVKP